MGAMTFGKWKKKADIHLRKHDPWRRKNYKKARFRRTSMRFELSCVLEEIEENGINAYVILN